DLMNLWPGEIVAKIGAEGVYSAAIPGRRLGIAVKVEDGDLRWVGVALLAVIRQILERDGGAAAMLEDLEKVAEHAELPVRTTRGALAGVTRASGSLEFFRPVGAR